MDKLHVRVSKIIDRTVTVKEMLPTTPDFASEYQNHCSMLQNYAKALLSYSPGLKFARKRSNELWVYLDNDPYVLGYIGYGDYLVHVTGEHKYMVASRNIENEKYATYNDQHSMYTSVNLKTILTKARKAMRPINPIDIATMESRNIQDKFKREVSDKSNDVYNTWSKVFDKSLVEAEFRNMIKNGYEFVNKKYRGMVQELLDKIDIDRSAKMEKLHVHFVRAYDKYGDGELHFEIIDINDLHKGSGNVVKEIVRCRESEVPEDILGKISVLNITDVDEYVKDVGYNTGDGMFYVVKQ